MSHSVALLPDELLCLPASDLPRSLFQSFGLALVEWYTSWAFLGTADQYSRLLLPAVQVGVLLRHIVHICTPRTDPVQAGHDEDVTWFVSRGKTQTYAARQ